MLQTSCSTWKSEKFIDENLEEQDMTVCIGALCDCRKTVVMISDRMWTEQSILYYEFEPEESKIEKLSESAAVASAGSVVLPNKIIKLA